MKNYNKLNVNQRNDFNIRESQQQKSKILLLREI